jgi:uncharacterized protein (DUF3820 family)
MNSNNEKLNPEQEHFLKLARTKMPFGKYAGTRLIDIPENYIVWFSNKGFPPGQLGDMLREVYEIKLNGLEYLFAPFRNQGSRG